MQSDVGLAEHWPALEVLLREGCLARRLLARVGPEPSREQLHALYAELCSCLRENRLFHG